MFVVIEGIDGAGKGTVARALVAELRQRNLTADLVSFPRYGHTLYGNVVSQYLNGNFGNNTHPLLHGTLFSLDRFESRPYLLSLLETLDVVVSDRYVPSNLCYSAMKAKPEERDSIVEHFLMLDYGLFALPRPTHIVFLDVPVETAVGNIAKKSQRTYTAKAADLHEADPQYLGEVRKFYLDNLVSTHPSSRHIRPQCVQDGAMLSVASIVKQITKNLFQESEHA